MNGMMVMKMKILYSLFWILLVFAVSSCAFVKETKDHPAVLLGERTKVGLDISATDQTGAIKGGMLLGYKHETFVRFNPLDKGYELIKGDNIKGTAYDVGVGSYLIIRVGDGMKKETDVYDYVKEPEIITESLAIEPTIEVEENSESNIR